VVVHLERRPHRPQEPVAPQLVHDRELVERHREPHAELFGRPLGEVEGLGERRRLGEARAIAELDLDPAG